MPEVPQAHRQTVLTSEPGFVWGSQRRCDVLPGAAAGDPRSSARSGDAGTADLVIWRSPGSASLASLTSCILTWRVAGGLFHLHVTVAPASPPRVTHPSCAKHLHCKVHERTGRHSSTADRRSRNHAGRKEEGRRERGCHCRGTPAGAEYTLYTLVRVADAAGGRPGRRSREGRCHTRRGASQQAAGQGTEADGSARTVGRAAVACVTRTRSRGEGGVGGESTIRAPLHVPVPGDCRSTPPPPTRL